MEASTPGIHRRRLRPCTPGPWRLDGVTAETAERDAHVGAWFKASQGKVVQLEKTRLLRVLLVTLVDSHEREPRAIVSRETMISALWPGESMSDRSADNRLNVAITKLRQLGLEKLVLRSDEGWQLAPETPLTRMGLHRQQGHIVLRRLRRLLARGRVAGHEATFRRTLK